MGCFHFGGIINNVAINMNGRLSLHIPVLSSYGHILRSEITGSYDIYLIFLETAILFPKMAPPFYIPTSSTQLFLFLHILANTCSSPSFLKITILMDVKWYSTVVLLCFHFFNDSDVKHFFMCLLAICISSEKVKESESEVAHSCLTLCNPVDCSLPGSSVHGIPQARMLEWAAISSSRGSSQPRDKPMSPASRGEFFTTEPRGKP